MSRDVPTEPKDPKRRGFYAREANDPTLASYASSLLYLLSVPTLIGLAYAGYFYDLYPYSWVIPVFGGLLLATLTVTFGVIHVLTGN